MENSAQGLSMLDPEHKVVVTGEEHHQPALAPWAPRADGRPRRVAAELGFVTGPRGRRVIEVRVDGRRVGILTVLMSERYAPHVHDVLRRGGRPGCVATVVRGRRGLVEVQVFLPEVARDGTSVLPPAPLPPPAPSRPGAGPGPGGPGRGRRHRRPLWVGAGVLAALVVLAGALGNRSEEVPTVPAAAPSATQAAPPTTRAAATPSPSADSPVGVPQASVASVPTTRASQTRAPAPATASPAPRTTTRAPDPEPARAAAPERAGGGCHPSYSPCLPDGPDLDCGDVDGPVSVTGPDEYRLDADNDGVGCE